MSVRLPLNARRPGTSPWTTLTRSVLAVTVGALLVTLGGSTGGCGDDDDSTGELQLCSFNLKNATYTLSDKTPNVDETSSFTVQLDPPADGWNGGTLFKQQCKAQIKAAVSEGPIDGELKGLKDFNAVLAPDAPLSAKFLFEPTSSGSYTLAITPESGTPGELAFSVPDSGSDTGDDTGDDDDSTSIRRVVFTTQPTKSITGSPIAPGPQVAIQDPQGKVLNIPDTVAVVSFGKNAGCDAGACGDLSGNLTVRFEKGYAKLDQLYVNRRGIGYQLKAEVADIGSAVSSSFDVLAPGDQNCVYMLGGNGQTGKANQQLPQPIRVQAKYPTGQFLPGARVLFQSTLGGGTFSPAEAQTDKDGIAESVWTLGNQVGGHTATAGLIEGSNCLVTFSATAQSTGSGSGGSMEFLVQPGQAQAGLAFFSQPVIVFKDSQGAPVNVEGLPVKLELKTNAGVTDDGNPQVLSGASTVNARGNIAQFSGLSLVRSGTGFVLRATADGFDAIESQAFNVAARE